MQNNPRQLILQLKSLQDFLKLLAFEAQFYGNLLMAHQDVGGGSCSSDVDRASIQGFINRLSGGKKNIIQRTLDQADSALARMNQPPIQNVAAIRNGNDLAGALRERAMSLDVLIFQIRANLPVEDMDDVVNIYSNKKP